MNSELRKNANMTYHLIIVLLPGKPEKGLDSFAKMLDMKPMNVHNLLNRPNVTIVHTKFSLQKIAKKIKQMGLRVEEDRRSSLHDMCKKMVKNAREL